MFTSPKSMFTGNSLNCHFNLLVRRAIGLHNANGALPPESTCDLFRKRIVDDTKSEGRKPDQDCLSTFARILKRTKTIISKKLRFLQVFNQVIFNGNFANNLPRPENTLFSFR